MTKKYFIIGNPVKHSLSPKIHNFWFKQNNIDATYEKKFLKANCQKWLKILEMIKYME